MATIQGQGETRHESRGEGNSETSEGREGAPEQCGKFEEIGERLKNRTRGPRRDWRRCQVGGKRGRERDGGRATTPERAGQQQSKQRSGDSSSHSNTTKRSQEEREIKEKSQMRQVRVSSLLHGSTTTRLKRPECAEAALSKMVKERWCEYVR